MGIAMRIVEASTTASRSHLYSSPEGQMDTAVLWRMAQLNYLFFSSALSDSVRLWCQCAIFTERSRAKV